MELVSYVENEHVEEEQWNVKAQSTPKSDREAKLSRFVFSDSMLYEFLELSRFGKEKVKNRRQYTRGKVL